MTIEMQQRPRRRAAETSDYVDPRIFRGVLRATFGGDSPNVVAQSLELSAEPFRAGRVVVARRIDRWDCDQVAQKLDPLARRRIHPIEDSLFLAGSPGHGVSVA